jgi:hypothetical protein
MRLLSAARSQREWIDKAMRGPRWLFLWLTARAVEVDMRGA